MATLLHRITRLGFLTLTLLSTEAWAETNSGWAERLYLGGKIGVDFATHAGPGANNQFVGATHKLGFAVGGTTELRMTRLWSAQVEILLTRKGPDASKDGMHFGSYRMYYLEFPFLARITGPVHDGIDVYGVLGPVLSILLDADVDLADGRQFDLDNGVYTMDYGLMLGAGTAVNIGAGAITLDVRYTHGFPNIDKTAGPEDDDVMNRAFYLTVGYRANLDNLLHGF